MIRDNDSSRNAKRDQSANARLRQENGGYVDHREGTEWHSDESRRILMRNASDLKFKRLQAYEKLPFVSIWTPFRFRARTRGANSNYMQIRLPCNQPRAFNYRSLASVPDFTVLSREIVQCAYKYLISRSIALLCARAPRELTKSRDGVIVRPQRDYEATMRLFTKGEREPRAG